VRLQIPHTEKDFPIHEFNHKNWLKVERILINKHWSGEDAPVERHVEVKLLWSNSALYVRFEANQSEPLNISEKPNLENKTIGLWDRDVCEIFVTPDRAEPRKYFEFEVAPNGEWIDLAIDFSSDERETDWDYYSGMRSAAKIEKDKIWTAMKIEWKAFGKFVKAGDVWLGNLFRIVGSGENRGYLAWQPTRTEKPNFHVP
jgi:alpha-galactosidase